MLLSQALVKFPGCRFRVACVEELKPEQVQGMNGEPGREHHPVWLMECTRRQEFLWLMSWSVPEVHDSSPSLIFKHKGSIGLGPSKQAINKCIWKLEEGHWLSEQGDFSVPSALGRECEILAGIGGELCLLPCSLLHISCVPWESSFTLVKTAGV